MDFSLFKKHPAILIGVAIVGAYIFYELAIAGGSSGGTVMVQGPSSGGDNGQGQYAAQVAGTIAGLQAQAQAHQDDINAALAGQASDNATKITLATLAANSSGSQQQTAVTGTLDLASITGAIQESLQANNNTTQVTLTKENNATALTNARILSDTQTNLAQIGASTGLAYADIASKSALGLAGIQAGTTVSLAQIQGDVTSHAIDAQSAVTQQAIKSKSSSNLLSNIIGAITTVAAVVL